MTNFKPFLGEEKYRINHMTEVSGKKAELICTGVLNTVRGTYKITCPVTTKNFDRNNPDVTSAAYSVQVDLVKAMNEFLMNRVKELNLEDADPSQMEFGFEEEGEEPDLYVPIHEYEDYAKEVEEKEGTPFKATPLDGRPLGGVIGRRAIG